MRYILLLLLLACGTPLLAQYAKIDRHAQKAPQELTKDLPELVEYLIQPATSETEQARALFSWVVNYLKYDDTAAKQDRRINQNIRDILNRKRGLCMDYTRLYKAMCGYAGLQCVIVDGYVKSSLSDRSLPERANHSWNAVWADGQWHLLDPTWAGGKDELTHEYETSYFFTPPELLVLNHLPMQPMWQLLPCPITPEDFQQTADSIQTGLSTSDSCFAYTDSITYWLELPERKRVLHKMQQAYAFHPTLATQGELAHSMLDYAVALDEQSSALPFPDSIAVQMLLQKQAIALANQAAEWITLKDWQQQLLAQLHLNYAISLYQDAEGDDELQLTTALKFAEEGLNWLQQLPEGHYYRSYAEKQCAQLLEEIHYWLDK
jgi:hypothetical protein